MLLATSDLRTDYQVLGMVKGSCMRARHLGQDIMASLRKVVGGEVQEYASLLKEAREAATEQMVAEAQQLGANAIIGIRFSTSTITTGAAEIIVYGTAVKI
ncbi:MAG: YbjQ family protein [bacterium]|nr:YbjQ family protein [bacterium]